MTTSGSGPATGSPPMIEGMAANGKYLRLEVPNFNAASGAGAMTTYLHLGAVRDLQIAASPTAPLPTGEDLASYATTFIDDTRLRDGCPDFVPEGTRQAETAKLHTKGGWRDHSDGNRVSTTRGDKVEIIKGNYRMVVLGRQDDQAGVDISGGHVSQGGITFDGSSVIEYTTVDYGGTWVVVENTRKGHVHTAYHGRVFDYYCGETVESVTGSESPTALMPNPEVTNKTWALSIESYTGSAALKVPTMASETWAGVLTDTTTADTMTWETTVTGVMTQNTTAGTMATTNIVSTMTSTTAASSVTDTTTVSGAISSSTSASTITNNTTASSITDTTTAGTITSTTTGNTVSTSVGNSTSTITGNDTTTINGTMMQTINGTQINTMMGMDISMVLGLRLAMFVGLAIDLELAGKITIAPLEIANKIIKLQQTETEMKNNGETFVV